MGRGSDRRGQTDTHRLRTQRDGGFNARVESMWDAFDRYRDRMNFFECWKERRRTKLLISRVNKRLSRTGVKTNGWDQRGGKCVCNFRIARMGIVAELRTHIEAELGPKKIAGWKQLAFQNESNALAVPLDFPEPFRISARRSADRLHVTSSVRLAKELEQLNEALGIGKTFALGKMSKIDFLDANERDISEYESRFASLDDFWPKFTTVVLKKLADKSVASGLPIHFA